MLYVKCSEWWLFVLSFATVLFILFGRRFSFPAGQPYCRNSRTNCTVCTACKPVVGFTSNASKQAALTGAVPCRPGTHAITAAVIKYIAVLIVVLAFLVSHIFLGMYIPGRSIHNSPCSSIFTFSSSCAPTRALLYVCMYYMYDINMYVRVRMRYEEACCTGI